MHSGGVSSLLSSRHSPTAMAVRWLPARRLPDHATVTARRLSYGFRLRSRHLVQRASRPRPAAYGRPTSPHGGDPDRGFESCSLRQPVRVQHSPLTSETAEIPNKYGASRANLRTAIELPRPRIPALWPLFSKPPDCADLVRNS
jgi:hypothetical protein